MEVSLSKAEYNLATYHAQKAQLGGVSHVRSSADRAGTLNEDQLVGQLGTLAFTKYLYGNIQPYVMQRHFQDQYPALGDGGSDLPGTNVDVKTSLMRKSQDPTTYNLCVRPRERHEGWVYVLALLPSDYQTSRTVHLLGWCSDSDLPAEPKADGPLKGAFVVPINKLTPLPPIRYDWFVR